MACIAAKPIVDGLEKELEGKLVVLRFDVQDPRHKDIVETYRVRGTPTFVLLDAGGAEVWRSVGSLDAQQVRNLVNTP